MSDTVEIPLKYRYIFDRYGQPVWWAWCQDTFGPANNCTYGRPATVHYWRLEPGAGYKMWFADPVHATMFRLRWT